MKFCLSNWFGVTSSLAFAVTFSSCSAYDKDCYFERVSTFDICKQIDGSCNTDTETVAETLWFFTEGDKTKVVYTDSEEEQLGFVDITDPSDPKADGVVALDGEPTTVRYIGEFAVVGVNTSPDYVNPSGQLTVVKASDRSVVAKLMLPGQPDAVDVSKEDSSYPKYIAVAIENERDEDLGDGSPPQMPPGYLSIFTIASKADLADPTTWTQRQVDVSGLPSCRFGTDPEPEYVTISDDNTKVVLTMQENNCNAVIDLASGAVLNAFDAGSVDLTSIDILEEDVIRQNATGTFLREPDGATWIGSTNFFATANEGDLDGGSRGFSIFDADTGAVIYDSGNTMDKEVVRVGHYPENRSGNKGNEPENVLYGEIDDLKFLFVASERSNCVFVYEVSDPANPDLVQIVPTGIGPEGLAFNKEQKILAVAAEKDDREDGFRSSITFFKFAEATKAEYPTLESTFRKDLTDTYIPFGALSGLAAATDGSSIIFTVEDSFYRESRILCIDTSMSPPCIVMEDYIKDTNGVLDGGLVNDDMTVNLDLEGIAAKPDGGWWVISKADSALISISADHVVESVVNTMDNMMGLDVDGDKVIVVEGMASGGDPNPVILVYDSVTESVKRGQFVLPTPTSQNGGKVCLTDIAFAGDGKYYVLLGDDQGGADATIKQIHMVDLGDYSFEDNSVIVSELYLDLIPSLTASNGPVPQKVEGLTIDALGNVFIVNDNMGVQETFFLKVANIPPAKVDTPSPTEAPKVGKKSKGVKKGKKEKKVKSPK